MKERINLSIAQFEDLYSEWDDYRIRLVDEDSISVFDTRGREDAYDIFDAKEILTDFKSVLKKNNLMISSSEGQVAKITPYTYGFEAEFETLADRIENELGTKITNLSVLSGKNGLPFVKFEYASNMTSGERSQIRKKVERSVNEFIDQNRTNNVKEENEQ